MKDALIYDGGAKMYFKSGCLEDDMAEFSKKKRERETKVRKFWSEAGTESRQP